MSRIRIVAVTFVIGATLAVTVPASGQSAQHPDYTVVVPGQAERLPLNDTRWVLASATLPVPPPSDTARITLMFRGVTLDMSSGCNRGSTSYSVSRTHELGISPYVVTRMSCPGALEQWEPAFFKFLGATPTITVDGNALVLKTADAEMRFKRILD